VSAVPTTISGLIRLIVATFFIAGTIIASGALYLALRNEALVAATNQSQLLISAIGAVRDYTDQEVFPAVGESGGGAFHKESVPFFAAKSVFSRVAALFPAYSYRQTALNPTNTDDRPDPFEVELTDRFKVNVGLDELSGIRYVGEQTLFYLARPIRIEDARCLVCHGAPDKAPAGMVAEYGSSNGFGWQLHDVVGAQILSVPVTRELRGAVALAIALAAGLFLVFGLTYLTLTSALDAVLVRPLRKLADAAEAASLGTDVVDLPTGSAAEIGRVADAIVRLRRSLDKALRRAAAAVRESVKPASERN
jgi:hypothetical protein